MKLNLKIIIPFVLLIVIAWVGNYSIYYTLLLDQPILLKSYLAYPMVENEAFKLRYITNRYDNDRVLRVRLPEINSDVFYSNYSEEPIANGNFKLITLTVDINTIFLNSQTRLVDADMKQPISIKTIELITNKNNTYTYNVGQIVFFKEDRIEDNPVTSVMSGSSSRGYNESIYLSKKDITIHKIESPMLERIPEICELKVNDSAFSTRLTPLNFKAQERIHITFSFKSDDAVSKEYRYAEYFFPVLFQGTDKNGRPCQIYQHIYSQPNTYFTVDDIRQLKKESR